MYVKQVLFSMAFLAAVFASVYPLRVHASAPADLSEPANNEAAETDNPQDGETPETDVQADVQEGHQEGVPDDASHEVNQDADADAGAAPGEDMQEKEGSDLSPDGDTGDLPEGGLLQDDSELSADELPTDELPTDELQSEEWQIMPVQGIVQPEENNLFFEKDFSDYTVTEGLLLLTFVTLFCYVCLNLTHRLLNWRMY